MTKYINKNMKLNLNYGSYKTWTNEECVSVYIFRWSNYWKRLSPSDIEFLQKENSKLKFEKEQLEKEHHHIHQLIAKATIYLINLRNTACEEITKGHNIAGVGEKLLEHFGKIINEETSYDFGRKKIIEFLESLFSLNRIKANKLFALLEKSRVLHYEIDILIWCNIKHIRILVNLPI